MGNNMGKHVPEVDNENPYVKKIMEAREKLSGWERVQLMFQIDDYGQVSPELKRVLGATMLALVVGAGMGAMGRGRISYQNFMRSNAHEIFETPLQAKRKLQDSVTLGMASGGYRISWRLGLFTGIYMMVSSIVSTYRGKMAILDQTAGGGTAGFLYKLMQGPKASISGAIIGSGLGLGAGIMTYGITKLTGQTIDSANLQYYSYLAKKDEKQADDRNAAREFRANYDPASEESDEIAKLARFHDKVLKNIHETDLVGLESVTVEASPIKNVNNSVEKVVSVSATINKNSSIVTKDTSPSETNLNSNGVTQSGNKK